MPSAYRLPLRQVADSLAERIDCPAPSPKHEKRQEDEEHEKHGEHEHGHGKKHEG